MWHAPCILVRSNLNFPQTWIIWTHMCPLYSIEYTLINRYGINKVSNFAHKWLIINHFNILDRFLLENHGYISGGSIWVKGGVSQKKLFPQFCTDSSQIWILYVKFDKKSIDVKIFLIRPLFFEIFAFLWVKSDFCHIFCVFDVHFGGVLADVGPKIFLSWSTNI